MKRGKAHSEAKRLAGRKARFDAKRIGPTVEDHGRHDRGCLTKVRYPDEHTARASAYHLFEAAKAAVPELWVYRCDNCRGWHLTSRRITGAEGVKAVETMQAEMDSHYARPRVRIFRSEP